MEGALAWCVRALGFGMSEPIGGGALGIDKDACGGIVGGDWMAI